MKPIIKSLVKEIDVNIDKPSVYNSKEDPWFSAPEIGNLLEIIKVRNSIKDFTDEEVVKKQTIETKDKSKTTVTCLTKSGVYKLLSKTKSANAGILKEFMDKLFERIELDASALPILPNQSLSLEDYQQMYNSLQYKHERKLQEFQKIDQENALMRDKIERLRQQEKDDDVESISVATPEYNELEYYRKKYAKEITLYAVSPDYFKQKSKPVQKDAGDNADDDELVFTSDEEIIADKTIEEIEHGYDVEDDNCSDLDYNYEMHPEDIITNDCRMYYVIGAFNPTATQHKHQREVDTFHVVDAKHHKHIHDYLAKDRVGNDSKKIYLTCYSIIKSARNSYFRKRRE